MRIYVGVSVQKGRKKKTMEKNEDFGGFFLLNKDPFVLNLELDRIFQQYERYLNQYESYWNYAKSIYKNIWIMLNTDIASFHLIYFKRTFLNGFVYVQELVIELDFSDPPESSDALRCVAGPLDCCDEWHIFNLSADPLVRRSYG